LNPFGSGSVANTTATTDPLGGNTADFIQENTSLSEHRVISASAVTVVSGSQNTSVIYAKQAAGSRYLVAYQLTGVAGWAAYVDLSTGSLVSSVAIGVGVGSASVSPAGNGWHKVTITLTAVGTNVAFSVGLSDGVLPSYLGNGTSGIYIWGADLRPTNQGVGLPAYQRVNTSTDYDSTGFPTYIKPNGSNQFMQTNSINFTATDKMTVWQGVRKLSDAANGVLVELSSSISTNNGVFTIQAPQGASAPFNHYTFASKGTAFGLATTATGYPSPITNVLTGIGDISGDIATLRINGVQTAQGIENQGTGNFGNYPAYFYMRGGTILPFSGNDYGSIARGAASTAAQITAGETYINSKTKAF
jgi:hypothetical protein